MQNSPVSTEPNVAAVPQKPSAPAAAKKSARAVAQKAASKPRATAPAKPTLMPAAKPAKKPAAKPAVKAPAKAANKPSAKPLPKAAPAKPAAPKLAKPAKEKKIKMVRDSISIPKSEYEVLDVLKLRAGKLGVAVKKTELIRAGIKALAALPNPALLSAIAAVPNLKTGRPPKAD